METDLEHFPHLRFVTTHENTSVVAGNILYFRDDGVDYCGLVWIYLFPSTAASTAATIQGVSLVKARQPTSSE